MSRAIPETSIIVRTFNEERFLPSLFDALAQQTYTDFQTVVVDSGSYDRTRDIAANRADKVLRIAQHDFTYGHSLNVGISHSVGKLLVIVSAHAAPRDADWLERLLKPLADPQVAMTCGRQLGWDGSKFGESVDMERVFGPEARALGGPYACVNNANSAVQRCLWATHPFDESLPGLEDLEWAKHWMERGRKVVYVPEAAVYHMHDESWEQVRRRYFREALAAKWIGLRHRRDIPREMWNELRRLRTDLKIAWRKHELRDRYEEIVRFRFEKSLAIASGTWQATRLQNPLERDRLFFNRQARAVVVQGPGRASLEEIEMPSLKPGDVLIKVAYEGVCGTDIEIFDGTLGYYRSGRAKYPITPGHEFSGRVVALGSNVSTVGEGDRVVVECIQSCHECADCRRQNWTACERRREVGVIGLHGGYADYVIVPGRFVHGVPAGMPLRAAAMCEPTAVVLKGLKRLNLKEHASPKRCGVIGAGPIGHLCAAILRMRGHEVLVYDRSPNRLSCLDGTGVGIISQLDDLGGFDILIDATGAPEVVDAMVHNSDAGTTILLLGLPYARRAVNFEALVSYDKAIVGSVGSSSDEFEEALELLPRLKMEPFLRKQFPLQDFHAAWRCFEKREYLKIMLAIDTRLDD